MVKLSFFMEIKINCALLVSVKYKKEGKQCTIVLLVIPTQYLFAPFIGSTILV